MIVNLSFQYRLNTDILLASNCGLKSLLVLSGISTLADVEVLFTSAEDADKKQIPDYYVASLGHLKDVL